MQTCQTRFKQLFLHFCLLSSLLCGGQLAWAEPATSQNGPTIEYTPYGDQKVVFEFYFDDPIKLGTALYWIRTLFYTLGEKPYDIPPDFINVKVVMHGTEVVTLAKKNYEKYKVLVERMRYYADLGVDFRVCALSLEEFGYRPSDMQDFITIVPSAITELAHWQLQGYALIIPRVYEKHYTIDELH